MAAIITKNCINCGACIEECPVVAIYPPGTPYFAHGRQYEAVSPETYYIAPQLCNCRDKAECMAICPMQAIEFSLNNPLRQSF